MTRQVVFSATAARETLHGMHGMHGPRQVVDRYVEIATADGKAALAELFAPDGVFHAPDGSVYRGREQIAAFYARHLATVVPKFHVHRALEADQYCWVELANPPIDAPVLLSSNHFTVDDDGLISRLAVFLRPR
jgi:SnoaL-like domain